MDESERALRSFIDVVWNQRRLDRFADHVSEEVRFHPMRGLPTDFATYLGMATAFQGAFSDLRIELEQVVVQADRAAGRLVITGTNDGPFRGFPPTGKRVRVAGHPICRVEGGKIAEFWQLFDELGMMQQLGHAPP